MLPNELQGLSRLDKSLNMLFESNVEWIRYSGCLSGSVVGIKDAFEMCDTSHRVVEKINTHLVTEFILHSLEGLVLTDSLGVVGNPRLIQTAMV